MFTRRQKKSAKSVQAAAASKIKETLLEKLVEAVKEIQQEYKDRQQILELNELTSQLCSVLEAIFLHGLKETFLGRLSSRLGSEFSPRMPEPSFWTFALVFTHKQVISTVEKYSQISSEVGKCRAWLRLALNDSLLVSYLSAMGDDRVSLSVHYENYAFLRDCEKLELASKYLAGVEVYAFSLATNVSMLNRWLPEPLSLAGLWNASMPTFAIDTAAVDAAATVADEAASSPPPGVGIRSLAQPMQSSSFYQLGLMNEDEALRLILQATPVSLPPSPVPPESPVDQYEQPDFAASVPFSPPISRSLSPQPDFIPPAKVSPPCEGSSGEENGGATVLRSGTFITSLLRSIDEESSAASEQSLEWELEVKPQVRESESTASSRVAEPSLRDELLTADALQDSSPKSPSEDSKDSSCMCSSLGPVAGCQACQLQQQAEPLQLSEEMKRQLAAAPPDLIMRQTAANRRKATLKIGFRESPVFVLPEFSLQKTLELTSCIDLIPTEAGVDAQDWRCVDCTKAIGAIFGAGKVCAFTRLYYCTDCHLDDLCVIPCRLLYSWDGRLQPCARSSWRFLQLIRPRPIFHLRTFNPSLLQFVPQLKTANRRRKELLYLSSYIAACSRATSLDIKCKLDQILNTREYLYLEPELYSLQDLEELYRGELAAMLGRAVALCTSHVEACEVCGGRGFICEVCQDRRPVYPFHLDSTSQCQACCTVFHYECSLRLTDCPKCERLAARSLDRLVTESRLARELPEP